MRRRGASDIAEFERLPASDPGRAVARYGGDLLDGHDAAWLEPERQRLRGRWLDALGELADRCAGDGELTAAAAYAERLMRADPVRAENYRRLIRLHAARGDPARALGVYHKCAAVWERELGVGPSAETRTDYAALLPRASPPPAAVVATLVGRAAERRQLVDLFRACVAGRAQLVLLTGEAGIGKASLVEDFRTWCAHQGGVLAEARCHAAERPLVYGPVTGWLRRPGGERARCSRWAASPTTGSAAAPSTDGRGTRLAALPTTGSIKGGSVATVSTPGGDDELAAEERRRHQEQAGEAGDAWADAPGSGWCDGCDLPGCDFCDLPDCECGGCDFPLLRVSTLLTVSERVRAAGECASAVVRQRGRERKTSPGRRFPLTRFTTAAYRTTRRRRSPRPVSGSGPARYGRERARG